MNNDFSILAQFLDSLGPEVSGHSATPLDASQLDKIKLFVEGKLNADERRALLPEIVSNESAIHELVSRIKASS